MSKARFYSGLMSGGNGEVWRADLVDSGTALLFSQGLNSDEQDAFEAEVHQLQTSDRTVADSAEGLIANFSSGIAETLKPTLEEGETILLGFSVWEGTIHKLRALVGAVRSELAEFESQCRYIGGGPSLNVPSADTVDFLLQPDFFDGLVYGGAEELLRTLNHPDFNDYGTDEMWAALQQTGSFHSKEKNFASVQKGRHVFHTPFVDRGEVSATLIPRCPHPCGFCLQGQHQFAPRQKSEPQAAGINRALATLDRKGTIDLSDPNPLMFPHFPGLLRQLDLDKVAGIKLFGDMYKFAGFGPGAEDAVGFYVNFLQEFPIMGLTFGNEAIQAESDGAWLQKAHQQRILTDTDYLRINQGSKDLLAALATAGEIDTQVKFNYIFHPGMDIDLWLKKLAFMKELMASDYQNLSLSLALLMLYPGSKLCEVHQGAFVYSHDLYDLETETNGLYYSPSQWGINFENALIMDVASALTALLPTRIDVQVRALEIILNTFKRHGFFADLASANNKVARLEDMLASLPNIFAQLETVFVIEPEKTQAVVHNVLTCVGKREALLAA